MLRHLLAYIGRQPVAEGSPLAATVRLRQLDQEIDLEHALQLSAAALGFIGAVLAIAVHRTFVLLPLLAFALLGQYAIQGWCPPVPLLIRLGLRSRSDIDRERYALAASFAEAQEPRLLAANRAGAD